MPWSRDKREAETERQRVRDRTSKSERAYERADRDDRDLLKGTCVTFVG